MTQIHQKKIKYKDAGVDIESGDACSKIFYNASLATFKNRAGKIGEPVVMENGFSGPVFIESIKNSYIVKNSDGCGTKAEIAQRMNKHDTLAFDLLAMVCDDAVCVGAEPMVAVNSLDVRKMNPEVISELAKGIISACEASGIAMVGGETAELGKSVNGHGEHPYIWNAEVTGIVEKHKLITGDKIQKGDSIVALQSDGFRSNGLSLARKILEIKFGKDYHLGVFKNSTWGQALLEPSRIYAKTILKMHGAYGEESQVDLHSVIHITGGGIPGNLIRVLGKKNLGATVNNTFEPCEAVCGSCRSAA